MELKEYPLPVEIVRGDLMAVSEVDGAYHHAVVSDVICECPGDAL